MLKPRNYITESEGGSPDKSRSGQTLLRIRSILKTVHRTLGEPSGVHPTSNKVAGLSGIEVPHGVRYITPVMQARVSYNGLLPLSQQPRVNKPEPWK